MSKISYEDKIAIQDDPSIPANNKVTDEDMNEIKNSVNELYDTTMIYDDIPVGYGGEWYAENPPELWLFQDGSTFDETIYKDLYEVLGTNVLPVSVNNANMDITTGEETFLGYKTDGKWTFVQRFYIGNLGNATSTTVSHNIDIANSNIIEIKGTFEDSDGLINFNIPNVSTANLTSGVTANIRPGTIYVTTGSDRTNCVSYISIIYTKNNDTFEPQYNIIKAKRGIISIIDGKTVGEVGISYLQTPPHNCKFIDGQNWLKADFPKLWKLAEEEIASGNNDLFVDISATEFLVKQPQFAVSYLEGDADFGELGKQGGEKTHKLTINEIPSHAHKVGYGGGSQFQGNNPYQNGYTLTYNAGNFYEDTQKTGNDQPHNNLPPYTVVNYWICYDNSPYTDDLNNLDDIVLDLVENKSIYDSGFDENGNWIRYADGTMIQSQSKSGQTTPTLWNGGIYFADIDVGNWSIPFVGTPHCISIVNNTTQFWCTSGNAMTPTSAGGVRLIRPEGNLQTYNVTKTAIGKWK